MSDISIEPEWLVAGAALLVLGTGGYLAYGAYQRRSRRKGLLARLERIGYQAAHRRDAVLHYSGGQSRECVRLRVGPRLGVSHRAHHSGA